MSQTQILSLPEIIPTKTRSDRRNQEDLFASRGTKINRTYECTWINGTPSKQSIPNIIVPAEGDLESLFADVATFYPEYSPITAYAYAIDRGLLPGFDRMTVLGSSADPAATVINDWNRRIQIGLIIAEILSHLWAARRDENDLSYAQCRNSLGFCLSRCGALYSSFDNAPVKSKWIELRELMGMDTIGSLLLPITWIFDALHGNASRSGKLTHVDTALDGLIQKTLRLSEFGNVLDRLYPAVTRWREGLSGHFDGRVAAFERITNAIIENGHDRETDSLAIAFFANLIQPGSLAHTKLLSRRSDRYPSILVWYALFVAASDEFDYERGFAGLGTKLVRDIESVFNVAARPTADVSLDELQVLSRLRLNPRSIKPAENQFILVSLIPGVDVYARLPVSDRDTNKDQIDRMLRTVSDRDRHLKALLQQALGLLSGDIKEIEPRSSRIQKPSQKVRR